MDWLNPFTISTGGAGVAAAVLAYAVRQLHIDLLTFKAEISKTVAEKFAEAERDAEDRVAAVRERILELRASHAENSKEFRDAIRKLEMEASARSENQAKANERFEHAIISALNLFSEIKIQITSIQTLLNEHRLSEAARDAGFEQRLKRLEDHAT